MVLFCGQCCVCRKRLSCPRCRSELIDSAWVVIVPGQKCMKKKDSKETAPRSWLSCCWLTKKTQTEAWREFRLKKSVTSLKTVVKHLCQKQIILLQIFNQFFSLSSVNISEVAQLWPNVSIHISTLLSHCYFFVFLVYRSLLFPSTSPLISHHYLGLWAVVPEL